MNSCKLSNIAEEDLIRIYHFGLEKLGLAQAENYYNYFFDCFDKITSRPFSFESISYIKAGYRRCVSGTDSIYFKVNDDVVEIITIIGRQDLNEI